MSIQTSLEIIDFQFQDMISSRNAVDISTSDVMELYEYKLASMGHAERAATASVEAASERCSHLQHRMAQLTAEMNSLHQLLFHTQQRREELIKAKKQLEETVQVSFSNQNIHCCEYHPYLHFAILPR